MAVLEIATVEHDVILVKRGVTDQDFWVHCNSCGFGRGPHTEGLAHLIGHGHRQVPGSRIWFTSPSITRATTEYKPGTF